MTVKVPYLDVVLAATPASVGDARRRVRAFAASHGAAGKRLAAIELAVSEAVANAVVHGYRDLPPGELRVQADIEQGELELVVTDDGRGFDDDPVHGLGLGLALIRRDALAFEIRDRHPAGVELWARFALV